MFTSPGDNGKSFADVQREVKDTLEQERKVKTLVKTKFEALGYYKPQDAELLAYRLAEIMVLSKKLYTGLLPDLIERESNEEEGWGAISGIRMHLLHMKDCIDDFDYGLIELMEDDVRQQILEE